MRIARFSVGSDPQYGIVELAGDGGEHPDTVAALTGDPLATSVQLTGQRHPLDDVRLLAPTIPRSKVVGVGRNYAEHARELGNEVPETPLTFLKPNTSVIGPGESIVRPSASENVSFEGELAVVIGRICKEVPPERAKDVIFGYTIANDITARDWQQSDGQWSRAKGSDTFCPVGPWMITHLSVEEVGNLSITTAVNGEVRQDGSTADMLVKIPELIAYISGYTTLLPGDLILTGTPAGVGPLSAGDDVSITIEEIGTLSNPVVAG